MTPKSYLSFIDGYKTIYSENRSHIGDLATRMQTGLDKLVEASESVAQLSKELVVKEKELAVASAKADKVSRLGEFLLFGMTGLELRGEAGKFTSRIQLTGPTQLIN